MQPEPRELVLINLSAALLARLRAYCERHGSDPVAMIEWTAERALRRAIDVLEQVYPPEQKGE